MSTSLSKMARELQSIMSESDSRKTKPFDSEAEVVKVEGDYVYVHFAGGVDETPVRKTMDANVGDKVQVRVSSGKAWLIGNATAPPTDDKTANKALGQAATAFKSVKQLEDVVDQVTDEIDDISEDLGDLGDYAEELNEALTSTNNHFWVDDNSGAVYVSMADGDSTTGYAMRHAASGIVLLHDNEVLTSWTGSGQAYYSEGNRVALYSSDGALIGSENGSQINISSDMFSVVGDDGIEQFNIGSSSDTASKTISSTRTFPKVRIVEVNKVKRYYPTYTAFTLPIGVTIRYTGTRTSTVGSFIIESGDTGTLFSGTYSDRPFYLEIINAGTNNAGVRFYNNTLYDLDFTFSYTTDYNVPVITSIGSGDFGGNLSAGGSGSFGGDVEVTGEISCSNIGAAAFTSSATDTISSNTTWHNLSTQITIGPGTFVIMGHASFDENSNTYGKGFRAIRIYNVTGESAQVISTMQTPAVPSSVNTVLRTGTIVWPSVPTTFVVQARQSSGTDVDITSQLRYCRII